MPYFELEPHECPWCPDEVRDLFAVAHNACGAVEAALADGDWSRARRKLGQLRESLNRYGPALDAHFEDKARVDAIIAADQQRRRAARADWLAGRNPWLGGNPTQGGEG